MSLRAKLLLLTAFSLLALLLAFLSAWRTARTSRAFTLRQAEASVAQAAREIVRAANEEPRRAKRRPAPPHEQALNERYADTPARLTALALHRFAEVSGGFCDATGTPQGVISATGPGATFTANEQQLAYAACRQVAASQEFSAQKLTLGTETFFVASAPWGEMDGNPNQFSGAFAVRRAPAETAVGAWPDLLTQMVLLLSAVGLAGFSWATWRGWQRDMRQVKSGLNAISGDLAARIAPPPTPELADLSRSVNDLTAHLEANLRREAELKKSLTQNEKLAALGRVTAGVAHEVRNPLASMKLKIQLAARNNYAPEKLAQTFGVLQEEIERLDGLVRKLLELSRPARLNVTRFSLSELIVQRLALIAEQAAQQQVIIEFAPAEGEISADQERLSQVLDNLFRNALEAMSDGGALGVALTKAANVVQISVSDTGAGLSQEARERLFEPFFTTKDRGTGLGLTISREIMEAHGGQLYAPDTEAGAAFVVELPVAAN